MEPSENGHGEPLVKIIKNFKMLATDDQGPSEHRTLGKYIACTPVKEFVVEKSLIILMGHLT